MEKKRRRHTIASSPLSPQEAAAGLDPLIQPINDPDDEPVYIHRRSSVFYLPALLINDNQDENIHQKKTNIISRCFTYMERFSGILYALLASFLFSCSNFTIIQLNVIIFDVLAIRFFILAIISFAFIIYKGYRPFPTCDGILVLIRSIFAAGGSVSFYLALSYLPLPDLTTVRYTQVVWTALLALIIFRERITLPTILASLLTLTGVICVAQPTFLFSRSKISNETVQEIITKNDNRRLIGMLVALTCALSISMSIVLNKKLIQRKVRQSIIMFYFLLTTFIIFSIIQLHYWIFSKSKSQEFNFKKIFLTKNFICACIVSLFQLVPMILSQKAVKREHPSIVTVVQSSDIIFAILLQNIFSAIKTNLLALIGSILVIASIFIVGGHKLWLDRQNRTCLPAATSLNALKVELKQ